MVDKILNLLDEAKKQYKKSGREYFSQRQKSIRKNG